jgi:hypothetical protein
MLNINKYSTLVYTVIAQNDTPIVKTAHLSNLKVYTTLLYYFHYVKTKTKRKLKAWHMRRKTQLMLAVRISILFSKFIMIQKPEPVHRLEHFTSIFLLTTARH